MVDRIRLNGMTFYGYHGVLPEERSLGQRFVVDVELFTDLRPAGTSDDIKRTVNYTDIYRTVRDVVTGPPFHLIEAVAEQIAGHILEQHPTVERVVARVKKPEVPIPGSVLSSSEVWIDRDRAEERGADGP
ncbi:MAG: dihydroneopterin aldolase [Chloroflexi bacterium]|nr:dihydroneopterin aldolase [Chloroflexota bacterium]